MFSRTRRVLTPLVLALPAAGLLAACGPAAPYAAKVNGDIVTAEEVDREIVAISRDPELVEAIEQQGRLSFRGSIDGTYDAVVVARVLDQQVRGTLIQQELERRDRQPGAEERETARTNLVDGYRVSQGGQSSFERFPREVQAELVERLAAEYALRAAAKPGVLDPAGLQKRYEDQRASGALERTCVRHILIGTEDGGQVTPALTAKANAVRAEVVGGADFATVAARESSDKGTATRGGSLDCFTREGITTSLVPEFAQAALALPTGQVSTPVQTSFGLHVIQVTERKVPSFPDVETQMRTEATQEADEAMDQLLQALRRDADVRINPRFGRWDRSRPEAAHVEVPLEPTTTLGEGQTPRNASKTVTTHVTPGP